MTALTRPTRRGGGPGSAPPLRTVTSDEVEQHTGLVGYVLNKLYTQHKLTPEIEWDDAFQVGLWAVWEALRRWDSTKGKQSTYLTSYIWGYVMRYQQEATKATGWHRTEGRVASIASLDAELSPGGPTILDRLAEQPDPDAVPDGTVDRLHAIINRLPQRQQIIGQAILNEQPVATLEMAERIGVSRGYCGELRRQVLTILANELQAA